MRTRPDAGFASSLLTRLLTRLLTPLLTPVVSRVRRAWVAAPWTGRPESHLTEADVAGIATPVDVAQEPDALPVEHEPPLAEPPAVDSDPAPAPAPDGSLRAVVPAIYASLSRRGRVGLWLVLVGWLALGAVLFGSWTGIIPQVRRAGTAVPATDLLLLAASGPDGAPALALSYRGPAGGSLLLLPAGTQVEVPGIGSPQSLARTLEVFGIQTLAISVANLLRTRVPQTAMASSDQLAALVDDIGGVTVHVPETVEVVEEGVLKVMFVRGPRRMSGAELVRFLTVDFADENELERVARQNAAWRAVLDAVDSTEKVAAAAASIGVWAGAPSRDATRRILTALGGDREVTVDVLPVERSGVTQTDLYAPDESRLDAVRRTLTGALSPAVRSGRRVRLLIGADGNVGPPVARMLVERGYSIVVSGSASRPYDVTRVVVAANTEEMLRAGREIVALMGVGRVGLLQSEQGVFDVTLVIGRDWAEKNGFVQSTPEPVRPTQSPKAVRRRT